MWPNGSWTFFVANYPDFKVVSIQQCPGRVAQVSFSKECVLAKEALERLGEVTIYGVQCFVLKSEPPPPPPRLVNVLI